MTLFVFRILFVLTAPSSPLSPPPSPYHRTYFNSETRNVKCKTELLSIECSILRNGYVLMILRRKIKIHDGLILLEAHFAEHQLRW